VRWPPRSVQLYAIDHDELHELIATRGMVVPKKVSAAYDG
jgi:hypothetical protein